MPKHPTIVDVARLAGVSTATVGRVINGQDDIVREKTRRRVLEAISQLGYERNSVAGSLRTDRTCMIALSIPDITNPFWPEVARGVQDTLEAHDYTVVTVNSDWDAARELRYLKMVRRNRFDGLIINPTDANLTDFHSMGIPIVILGSEEGYPNYDSVGSATTQAVQEALEYLYGLGHRRIGLIAGRSRRRRSTNRYHPYVAFLAKKQLRLDEALIVHSEFSLQAGASAMRELLSLKEPPSAVFAANDVIAIGAMQPAQAMGWRIPAQLSIIGMDTVYAAATPSPPLTTIAKPKYEIGVRAADMLLARLGGDDSPARHIQLACTLIERGSTAAPGR
jgi:DNA-binding LacI/PurR family transcriptional regulator